MHNLNIILISKNQQLNEDHDIPAWIGGEDSISPAALPISLWGGSEDSMSPAALPPFLEVAGIQATWMWATQG
jgi:hypothetical protein